MNTVTNNTHYDSTNIQKCAANNTFCTYITKLLFCIKLNLHTAKCVDRNVNIVKINGFTHRTVSYKVIT